MLLSVVGIAGDALATCVDHVAHAIVVVTERVDDMARNLERVLDMLRPRRPP